MRFWHLLVTIAVLGTVFALILPSTCTNSRSPRSDAAALDEPVGSNQESAEPAATGVELQVVDRPQYDSLLADHRGRVVLVDFWATWCAPCVEQFPHTVTIAHNLHEKGLSVVTMSMNDTSEREAIVAFLGAQKAGGLVNLISQYGAGPRSMEEFEIAGGALPHYNLYDRAGKLRYTFELDPRADKQFTLEDIDARVTELLAE